MRGRIVAGGIYHVLNRGVDKRDIFSEEADYARFIHDLFEFNDESPALNTGRFFGQQMIDVGRQSLEKERRRPRKLLVEVLAFCLMPNHYHLLLRPKRDDGISQFIKKLNGGYAKYFDTKYSRAGALFQGRYKSVRVTTHAHLLCLPTYIHLNPLDMTQPEWRDRSMRDHHAALRSLESYRWSSFRDYIGKKNFPSVTQRGFLTSIIGNPAEYRKETERWLRDIDLEEMKPFLLE